MEKELIKEYKDAPIIKRCIAYLLDIIMIVFCPYILIRLLYFNIDATIMWSIIALAFICYQTCFTWKRGQTPAQRLFSIKTIGVKKIQIPFIFALLRGLAMGLAPIPMGGISVGLLLGFLVGLIYVDPKINKRRTAWDLLARTCVIKAPPEQETISGT